jgi:hypothetical protein
MGIAMVLSGAPYKGLVIDAGALMVLSAIALFTVIVFRVV